MKAKAPTLMILTLLITSLFVPLLINNAAANLPYNVTINSDGSKICDTSDLDGTNTTQTPLTDTMNTNHKLEAFFEVETRNVTVEAAQNGVIVDSDNNRVDGTTVEVEYNSVYNLTAVPNTGYGLAYWTITTTDSDFSLYNPLSLTINSNKQINATFGTLQTLTVESSIRGTIYNWTSDEVTGTTVTTVNGGIYLLYADPDEGYAFSHWLLDGEEYSSENWLTLIIEGDHTIQAVFIAKPFVILAESGYDWPSYLHDAHHTAQSNTSAPLSNELLWKLPLERMSSSMAVVDNVIYVGSHSGIFYALNATSLREIWRYTTDDSIESSPTVANGVVYFGSYDGYFYALNTTNGECLWAFETEDDNWNSPVVVDNVVYFGTTDGVVYAFNATTINPDGQVLWTYTLEDGALSSSVVVDNGLVFLGSYNAYICALNATNGQEVWSYQPDSAYVWYSCPVTADGVLYIATLLSGVFAFNETTGQVIWQYTGIPYYVETATVFYNGILYVGDIGGNIYAFNANTTNPAGELLWAFNTEDSLDVSDGFSWTNPAIANGVIYFGSQSGYVYALNATTTNPVGSLLWYSDIGEDIYSSIVVSNGVLYFTSEDGYIYAFAENQKVTFEVSGLPDRTSWSVTFDGVTQTSMGDVVVYAVCPEGEFSYSITCPAGYTTNDALSGTITLTNDDVTKSIVFTETRTIIATKTTDNQTYSVGITSGNISASQFFNMTITPYASNTTTVVEFTLTGPSDTNGSSAIAIPKEAIPYGTIPLVYIDGVLADEQSCTEDSNYYYVTFSTHFSTHEIKIQFTAPAVNEIPTNQYPRFNGTSTNTNQTEPSTTPTPEPTTTPTATPTATPTKPSNAGNSDYLILIVAVAALVLVVFGLVYRRRKNSWN